MGIPTYDTLEFVHMHTQGHSFRIGAGGNNNLEVTLPCLTLLCDLYGEEVTLPGGTAVVFYRHKGFYDLVLASLFTMPPEHRTYVINVMGDGKIQWRKCHKRVSGGAIRSKSSVMTAASL